MQWRHQDCFLREQTRVTDQSCCIWQKTGPVGMLVRKFLKLKARNAISWPLRVENSAGISPNRVHILEKNKKKSKNAPITKFFHIFSIGDSSSIKATR